MVGISVGKKGSGKSALIRKLVYQRLLRAPRSLIFFHDPKCQIRGGVVFTSVEQARAHIAARGAPRLSIFRGIEDVEPLARLALELHDVALVLDEMDRACNDKRWVAPSVKRIVHEGRHERVDLFGTFRSTRNVSEDLINAADFVCVFRHSSAATYDVQTLRNRLGDAYADAATRLEPMQFVIWADEAA